MAEAVIMPKTGMAMEEGTIVEWLVKEGDVVQAGDAIVEIETDKSAMEVESECDGTILRILHGDGATVPVIEVIAWIGESGEAVPDNLKAGKKGFETTGIEAAEGADISGSSDNSLLDPGFLDDTRQVKSTPAAKRAARDKGLTLVDIPPSGRHGEVREADVLSYSSTSATPLAKRIAQAENLDLAGVEGSGHKGKVFSSDISRQSLLAADEIAADRREPLTRIQKITGQRMFQSHTEIPVVSMNTEADVTELLRIRKQLNETLGGRITINDFVMKATALALQENPRMNSVLDGDSLVYKPSINIGMAVATERGLLVPILKNADTLSLSQLSIYAAELAAKTRDGRITPDEMEGGTFTVSNIGIYGVTSFTPIINLPQAAILGVCAISEKLKLVDGQVTASQVMGLSITFDHRIVDGAEASVFFSRIRELLESPLVIKA